MKIFIRLFLVVFILSSTPGCLTTRSLDMRDREKLVDMVHPGDQVEIITVTGHRQRITVTSIDGKTIKGDGEGFELAQVARIDKVELSDRTVKISLWIVFGIILAAIFYRPPGSR